MSSSVDLPSIKRRLVRGIIWLGSAKALAQGTTWIISIVVFRLLEPADYGLMGMAALFSGFLLLFSELGLSAAVIQKADLSDEEISDTAWTILLTNLLLFAVLFSAAPLVAHYFSEPALTSIIRVIGVAFVLTAIGSPSGYMLARKMAFEKRAIAEFSGNVLGAVCTLALAMSGFGVWSLASYYVVQPLVISALFLVYHPLKIHRRYSLTRIRGMMNFGSQVVAAKVLWYISAAADVTIVGRMLGTTQLGFYTLAFQFSAMPIEKIVTVITQVAFPTFSAMQSDEAALRRYFLKIVGLVAFITFPMFLGLLAVAHDAVELFLTAKWLPAVLPLQILCIVSCSRAIETLNAPILLAKGRPGIPLANNFIQALLLPLAFYFGARHGITGVAVAWLLAWPVPAAVITAQTLGVLSLRGRDYLHVLKHSAAGSLLMLGLIMIMKATFLADAPTTLRLMVCCVSGALAYAGYSALFNRTALLELRTLLPQRRAREQRPSESNVGPDPTRSSAAFSEAD